MLLLKDRKVRQKGARRRSWEGGRAHIYIYIHIHIYIYVYIYIYIWICLSAPPSIFGHHVSFMVLYVCVCMCVINFIPKP